MVKVPKSSSPRAPKRDRVSVQMRSTRAMSAQELLRAAPLRAPRPDVHRHLLSAAP